MNRAAPAALAVVALVLAGCGLGAGEGTSGTRLTVTADFGARPVKALARPKADGEDTVMRLLQRNAAVATRFGGGFVQRIDGLAGGRRDGRPIDWFYYVNGIEADEGAAATKLHDGDAVWWDRHDWGVTPDVKAVVGSFPEPFLHGVDGRRLPVRVECVQARSAPCDRVVGQLTDRNIPAARGIVRGPRSQETLRIVVGTWPQLREDEALGLLERGPRASGVYATIAPDGRRITALDARGRVARRFGAGTGLIAATRFGDEQPVWVVTGTDAAGVAAAARGFDEGTLEDRFALVVSDDLPVGLPVRGPR
jgi:Domain of unknown function (DUF4430)